MTLRAALQHAPSSVHLLMTSLNLPLVVLLGGPLREEFGWCGCALPVLQSRLGWLAARYTAGRTASGRTTGHQR